MSTISMLRKSLRNRPALLGDIAAAAMAFSDNGEVLLEHGLLEHCAAAALEEHEEVRAFAVFGFKNQLRVVIDTSVAGASAEVWVRLGPRDAVWREGCHQLEFTCEVDRVEHSAKGVWLARVALSQATDMLFPFAGVLADLAVDKIVKAVGVAKLRDVVNARSANVSLDGGILRIDIDSALNNRASSPEAAAPPEGTVAVGKMMDLPVLDLIVVDDIRVSRQGVHFGVRLSEEGEELRKLGGDVASSARAVGRLFGSYLRRKPLLGGDTDPPGLDDRKDGER